MDTEVIKAIQEILYGIDQYEKGNEEYLDYILVVIDALKSYKYTALKSYIRSELLFAFSKLTTFIVCNDITDTIRYKEIISRIDEDLDFYYTSSKELQKYVKSCSKSLDYPNLDAAYLLTIKLSTILNVYASYLQEIRNMENSYLGSYSYYNYYRIEKEDDQTKDEVSKLVKSLEVGINNHV